MNISSKDLRNLIYNDLQFTKQDLRDLINKELQTIIKAEVIKVLNDEVRLTNIIDRELLRQIEASDYNGRRSYLVCTIDKIYHEIDKVIHEEVLKRLQVTLKDVD